MSKQSKTENKGKRKTKCPRIAQLMTGIYFESSVLQGIGAKQTRAGAGMGSGRAGYRKF